MFQSVEQPLSVEDGNASMSLPHAFEEDVSVTSTREPTQRELDACDVEEALIGNASSFGRLYERYKTMVFFIVLRIVKNADAAHEVTQNVFMLAMQKLGNLRDPTAFSYWLSTIAVRMSLNLVLRTKNGVPLEAFEPYVPDHRAEDPSAGLLHEEVRSHIQRVLATLKPMDHQVLDLFYLQQLSIIEISGLLSIPTGTVKRRLCIARRRFRKRTQELCPDLFAEDD